MSQVYEEYKALQVNLGSREDFFEPQNEARITRLLTGIARLIQHPRRYRVSVIHLLGKLLYLDVHNAA